MAPKIRQAAARAKRDIDDVAKSPEPQDGKPPKEPPAKKAKAEIDDKDPVKREYTRQIGVVERGHIYFFYRPKVQLKEVHSVDEVKNLHMLLVPGPPSFSDGVDDTKDSDEGNEDEMNLISEGADAVPAKESQNKAKKSFRLITIGKKQLPDPTSHGRNKVFWATVTNVGDDLHALDRGLGEKAYETKTRGERHNGPARLAARGAYAFVNNEARTMSKESTHLGYYLSHPSDLGEVQEELGLHQASSFTIQVKNPDVDIQNDRSAPTLPKDKRAKYSKEVMDKVFGRGTRGTESAGLRFAPCERTDLLDQEGAQILLIASHEGTKGLEESLQKGRGEALKEAEEEESHESLEEVYKELALHAEKIPAEALEGKWI